MVRAFATAYRLLVAALFGAQLFFATVAAQKAFPPEVAALPRGDPRRALAADQVGQMLATLDAATMLACAAAVALCLLLYRARTREAERGGPGPEGGQATARARASAGLALRAALPPLLAALCAATSALGTTPAIHALRQAGRTGEARFGLLHTLSAGLLLAGLLLLLLAALRPLEAREP